jgi:hypothetical protein
VRPRETNLMPIKLAMVSSTLGGSAGGAREKCSRKGLQLGFVRTFPAHEYRVVNGIWLFADTSRNT